MSASEFSKSLLKSSKIDAPLPHAKTRALAHVEQAMKASTSAANAVATSANAVTSAKLVYAVAATAVIAGAAGVGGGYSLAHLSPRAQTTSVESRPTVANEPSMQTGSARSSFRSNAIAPASSTSAPPASSATPAAAVDVCKTTVGESTGKISVSGGRAMTFAVKSNCSQDLLDVFWVDLSGQEKYRGRILPSELYWQDTWEGHVFRLRDHDSHALVKEIVATPIDTAPDRLASWKGPPTEEPLVAIGPDQKPIAEAPPAECAHGGSRAAVWHFENDRKDQVIGLVSVDSQCRETGLHLIEPGKKYDVHVSEGHAFRIRDAFGALLLDVPPSSLDTATYLTVP
jgi:hypothetical protein